MIAFECSVFIHGIFWIDSTIVDSGFGKFLNVFYLLVAKISLIILFWNLAFMYYLASRQLVAWVETMKSNDDPDILLSKFTLKIENYNRCDLIVKISIFLLSVAWSILKAYIHWNNSKY
jgi:hypothetical protein